MNRFKKELRARGYMLENDYEYLPCNNIESVIVDSEQASMTIVYNVIDPVTVKFDRQMNEIEDEDMKAVQIESVLGVNVEEFTMRVQDQEDGEVYFIVPLDLDGLGRFVEISAVTEDKCSHVFVNSGCLREIGECGKVIRRKIYRAFLSDEQILESSNKKGLGRAIAFAIAYTRDDEDVLLRVVKIETDSEYLYEKDGPFVQKSDSLGYNL